MTVTADFPELNSFGTVLKFALVLEQAAADVARLAATRVGSPGSRDRLLGCAERHARRAKQLERMRRERLNEMVLQPIDGLKREDYIPAVDLPTGLSPREAVARIAAVEETVARFYAAASNLAAHALPGVDKAFKRMGQESRSLTEALRRDLL